MENMNQLIEIPDWVTDSGVSDGALRLYRILKTHTDPHKGQACLYRSALAKEIGKSVKTVDRYLKELSRVRAVVVQPTMDRSNCPGPNSYTVITEYGTYPEGMYEFVGGRI